MRVTWREKNAALTDLMLASTSFGLTTRMIIRSSIMPNPSTRKAYSISSPPDATAFFTRTADS